MQDVLPMFFIVCGALALVFALFWLWQSLREVVAPSPLGALPRGASISQSRAKLLDEKQALLVALTDLVAEREAGKLSEDDFRELDARYRARAREVLAALDAQLTPHREQARTLIAQALGASGGAPAVVATALVSAPAEPQCAKCETLNEIDAVFCKKCGSRLAQEPVS
jgi:hypothetical protein